MASACVNSIGLSPENLMERSQKYSSFGLLNRGVPLGLEMPDEGASKSKNKTKSKRISSPVKEFSDLPEELDLNEFDGFEFRLEDPVAMLPADELFSDGKLVPLQSSVIRPEVATSTTTILSGVSSPDTTNSRLETNNPFTSVPYLLSPKAPRCSSRWRELLGFGKLYQSNNIDAKQESNRRSSLPSSNNGNGATRAFRQFLHRSSKSSNDSFVNLPLLKDADNESVSVSSSRPSLSSSSSGHDLDDIPRLSLDSDKAGKVNLNTNPNNRPKSRMVKTRTHSTKLKPSTHVGRSTIRRSSDSTVRGLSVDSPRMNSSGKIVFHSLERSSSSPSSLNGGPRFKHRGMERSYSANVRITPVLNVPVCSLRGSSKSGGRFGFPIFSSQQKREGSDSSNNHGGANRSQRFNGKSRPD